MVRLRERLSEEALESAVDVFKAVAHSSRLLILAELLDGKKCVRDICEILNFRQPNVSQHLAALKHSGLVGISHEGAYRCYYLKDPDRVRDLFSLIDAGLMDTEI